MFHIGHCLVTGGGGISRRPETDTLEALFNNNNYNSYYFSPSMVCEKRKRIVRRTQSEPNISKCDSNKNFGFSAKLKTFAKMIFKRGNTSKNLTDSTNNSKLEDSQRTSHERAIRKQSYKLCEDWVHTSNGRYKILTHLDDIGCRPDKNWFLLNDTKFQMNRLMSCTPLPVDCVALEELLHSESPKSVLIELIGALKHPYIYPVLDVDIYYSNQIRYACLVMPVNERGSLKDLIYKSIRWNEPWRCKYKEKSTALTLLHIQGYGRQILEALQFLHDRGIIYGHLHSGNVILQNGVARLSGLENVLFDLDSKANAVVSAKNMVDVKHRDVICFGHLLFEMCMGYELPSPRSDTGHLHVGVERFPKLFSSREVLNVMRMIFKSSHGRYPSIGALLQCDLFCDFRLREMRRDSISSNKLNLSVAASNLLEVIRRKQNDHHSHI